MATKSESKRPPELVDSQNLRKESNDTLIAHALNILADPKTRGNRKVTVATVCELTGLARNTIRGRPGALKRLKEIKAGIRDRDVDYVGEVNESALTKGPEAIIADLEKRVVSLLDQNAVLFEENFRLQKSLDFLRSIQKEARPKAV